MRSFPNRHLARALALVGSLTLANLLTGPPPAAAATPGPLRPDAAAPESGELSVRAMPNARATFAEALKVIGEEYVDGPRPDDAVWTSALEGVLDRLVQVKGVKVNALLSPEELAELKQGLAGQIVGVGVVIEPVQQVLIVKEVIPGGPAAAAHVQAGDRILAIDGKTVRGMSLEAAVGAIRGPVGSALKLELQRDASEWEATLTRAPIKVESTFGTMVDGDVAYVQIRSFGETTIPRLDALLRELVGKKPVGLVLDLRGCPGGRLEVAVQAADRFLAKGLEIVTLARKGGKKDVMRAETAPAVPSALPVAVLVDGETASGGELLAAALADHKRAIVVGEQTLGKGSVETIAELDNGWALKLTIARMVSPAGRTWQAKGLAPGFPVAAQGRKDGGYTLGDGLVDLAKDAQLKAAVSLLRLDRGR